MFSLVQKCAAPKIRAPVVHDMDEVDQLTFIRYELGMSSDDQSSEVGDRSSALVKYGAKPDP
jgi:hypothetical protein